MIYLFKRFYIKTLVYLKIISCILFSKIIPWFLIFYEKLTAVHKHIPVFYRQVISLKSREKKSISAIS